MKKWLWCILFPCFVYSGEVVSVEGDVKAFVNKAWQVVKKGDKISSGTKIMTGIKSSVEIQSPYVRVVVKPMTLLTYTEKTEAQNVSTDVGLQNGSVEVKYTKPPQGKVEFRVQTPKGTASVRGTEERVSYDTIGGMKVTVLSGHVEAVGRQLFADQNLGVSPTGKVWEDTEKLHEALGVVDEIKDERTFSDIQDLVRSLLGEELSLDDIAKLLGDPQKL
ncbi:MAG: FecR family protein [Brevinematales bacterium]|nr:FecR family protein [Brevinematales bacterium]